MPPKAPLSPWNWLLRYQIPPMSPLTVGTKHFEDQNPPVSPLFGKLPVSPLKGSWNGTSWLHDPPIPPASPLHLYPRSFGWPISAMIHFYRMYSIWFSVSCPQIISDWILLAQANNVAMHGRCIFGFICLHVVYLLYLYITISDVACLYILFTNKTYLFHTCLPQKNIRTLPTPSRKSTKLDSSHNRMQPFEVRQTRLHRDQVCDFLRWV